MGFAIVIKSVGLSAGKVAVNLKRFRIGVIARTARMLQLIGQEVATRSTEDYLSGPRPDKLGRRSGDLARSVNYKVSGNRVVIGSNLRYARIHELGGVIKAKGTLSNRAARTIGFGREPMLTFKIGDRWVSKAQVTIPRRPYLRPALKDARFAIQSIIRRESREALREAMA